MSDRRLVIVRRADKMNTAALGALADYAADPNPSTTLVLVAEKIAKNLRVYKAVDALGGVAEYKAPKKSEYPRTVVEMFAARGKTIGLDAAEVIVRGVGTDLRRIAIEIDKIVAFMPERERLSREDIEAVLSTTAPTSMFDILDSIGARDAKGALRVLADVLGEGESVHGVHAMALRHVRELLAVRSLLDRDDTPHDADSIGRMIGLPPNRLWTARNLIQQAKRFSAEDLIEAIRGAAETEAQMKTSRDARLAFERWLISVCG